MRVLVLAVVPFRFLLSIVPFRFVPFYPVPLATTLAVEWCAVSVLSSRVNRWALTFARGTRYRSAARYLLVQPSPRSSQLCQTRSPWMQLRSPLFLSHARYCGARAPDGTERNGIERDGAIWRGVQRRCTRFPFGF